MSGFSSISLKGYAALLKGAKFLLFLMFLSFSIPATLSAQSPSTLTENIKLYDEAVKQKQFAKAAKYGYVISEQYHQTNEATKTIEYLRQALSFAKKSPDPVTLKAIHHLYGLYNQEAKRYNDAVENFENALLAARQLKDTTAIQEELLNVATNYARLARFKKSIQFTEEAKLIALNSGDLVAQQNCYQLLTSYYKKLGDEKKSAESSAQYNLLVTTQKNAEQKSKELNQLKQNLEKSGDKLLEETKKLQKSNESLHMIESSLQATSDSLKVIEELSKNRELQIDLLLKDKELAAMKIQEQETRIQHQAIIRNFIIVGSLLAVALVVVLIVSYRKKMKANEKIDQQNKNIVSSINYAKRIQEAMLPKIDQHAGLFENSFILFKPRDTVSGDFYWLSDLKSTGDQQDIAFAAVDCTGHGVPGAFMSMIGMNALNGIVNRGIKETNLILDALDHEIRSALQQERSGNNDGMDIALCIYHKDKKTIEFSGAKNPLVYIQNNELNYIKGDVHSIGGSKKHKQQFTFKKHEVKIDTPTVVYLFSDGYKDQFGGKDNGKFMSKKLHQLLLDIHSMPMQMQMDILQKTIEEWKGDRMQTDDILVMGLKLSEN